MVDLLSKKITIFIGHYGSGKTTLAVNLALQASKQTKLALADIDVNNPYFRSRDHLTVFQKQNIDVIIPDEEIAFAEMPYLPKRLYSAFQEEQKLILDAGGLDVGTKVLGSLADQIKKYPYELWFVVNTYRPGTENSEEIIDMFHMLQTLSRLTITGIIHNSNLGTYTVADSILIREKMIHEAAQRLGITNVFNSAEESIQKELAGKLIYPLVPIPYLTQNNEWS